MRLAVELAPEHIAAANRLHRRLNQWTMSDRALAALAQALPGFDAEGCLLKTVAVNALYGTRLFAVLQMASHIERLMASTDLATADEGLVEAVADLSRAGAQTKNRRYHSFASKFCHFFIDPERFPIMDRYANGMLKRHLGRREYEDDRDRPYRAFVRNFRRLSDAVGHVGTARDLDHYLWITGQHLEWKRQTDQGQKARINTELMALFENPSPSDAADLNAIIVPPDLGQASKREL